MCDDCPGVECCELCCGGACTSSSKQHYSSYQRSRSPTDPAALSNRLRCAIVRASAVDIDTVYEAIRVERVSYLYLSYN